MSLRTWFKDLSATKKALTVSFLAVNAMTFSSNTMVTHRGVQTLGADMIGGAMLLMSPVLPARQWIWSDEAANSDMGATPVSFLGNQTKKVLPEFADTGLGIAFAISGAPGSYMGYTLGVASGIATNLATILMQERKPDSSPAP